MATQPYRNNLIKGAMAEQGINREKLAGLTGLSVGTISSIRAGSISVTLSNLITVADALGLSMEALFTKAEQVQEEEPAAA